MGFNILLFGGREDAPHDYKTICPVLQQYLENAGFQVDYVAEDYDVFTRLDASAYDAILLYHTCGSLTPAQCSGLLTWIASGKGFAGVHAATDSFASTPEYLTMIGAKMQGHTFIRDYTVSFVDHEKGIESKHNHPILNGIQGYAAEYWEKWPVYEFAVRDEQYFFNYDVRNQTLATALFKGVAVPVMWVKNWGKGRVFYTALGHDLAACQSDFFKKTLVNGVRWCCAQCH